MNDNLKTLNKLEAHQSDDLLGVLKSRFEKNKHRHSNFNWEVIESRLKINPLKLWSLYQMEQTGGEPDVIGYDEKLDQFIYCDCVSESPKERRSLCYDKEALESRKKDKPKNSAMNVAIEMGVELLTQEEYFELQKIENFDTKTSSWLKTPPEIRKLGGAIFGDKRYNQVFIYHNGVESYYAGRGFRGLLKI